MRLRKLAIRKAIKTVPMHRMGMAHLQSSLPVLRLLEAVPSSLTSQRGGRFFGLGRPGAPPAAPQEMLVPARAEPSLSPEGLILLFTPPTSPTPLSLVFRAAHTHRFPAADVPCNRHPPPHGYLCIGTSPQLLRVSLTCDHHPHRHLLAALGEHHSRRLLGPSG